MTAHNIGWTTSTRSNDGAPSRSRSTSSGTQSMCGSNPATHSPNRSANTGDESSNSTAIPAHCAPCPGNTNTAPSALSVRTPDTTSSADSPAATASSPASSSSRSEPSTTARCSSPARDDTNDRPTSASDTSDDVMNSRNRAACSRSAGTDRPESAHGTTPPPATTPTCPGSPSGTAAGSSTGACSTITCAFVPLTPNDDTPARRTRPVSGHAQSSVTNATAPDDQSTCGVGSSTCNVLGTTPCRIDSTILITPATPAAACV